MTLNKSEANSLAVSFDTEVAKRNSPLSQHDAFRRGVTEPEVQAANLFNVPDIYTHSG